MRNEVTTIVQLVVRLMQLGAAICTWLECDGLSRVLQRVLHAAGSCRHEVCFAGVVAVAYL
jgi:hypothetical protein